MKKTICALLAFWLTAQPLVLAAAEAAKDASKETAKEEAAPELPVAVDAKDTDTAPAVDAKAKADVETPQGEPEAKTETVKVLTEKPKRFLWGNFFLGAAGGALLGGVVGFLGFTQSEKTGGIDYNKARVVVPLATAGGALVGGVLSVLLGATTPPPATPPDMSRAYEPGLQAMGNRLIYSVQF